MARLLSLLRAAVVLVCLGAAPLLVASLAPAQAQDQVTAPDYPTWEKFATHAESVISDAHTTNLALDQLRKTVVDWRSQFQAAQSANKTRIGTLQQQIAALGPAPAEGVTEAPEIAQRRTALGDQLAKLQAPGLAADEAYSRADGIVREIDKVQLTRQADALMHLSPAPVNPANWPAAMKLASDLGTSIWGEIQDAWSIDNRRVELRSNLPLILGYLAFALVLLARGQRWIGLGVAWVRRRASDRGTQVLVLLASLGQIVLPFIGVLALIQAITSTGMLGMVGQTVLQAMAPMGLTIFAARWLGGQMFPRQSDARPVLDLTPERRTEGRFHAALLGILVALEILRSSLLHSGTEQEAANAVVSFPILAISAFALFRLGRLLKLHATLAGEADAVTSYRHQVVGLIARGVMVLSIAAALFAAAGYIAAASATIFPAALSLALMGLLVLAQRLVDDIYRWVTNAPATDDDGLLPVLIGFALTLVTLPVFALIWGARVADLAELWTQASQGFSIGSTRISPTNFLTFAIIFGLGYGVTRLVQGALKATLLPKTRIDLGGQNAIVVGVGYLGIVLAALIAITAAGIDLSGLAIVAGALSVGIGFGLQNIVSNFVSGLILLIERPVSEGDWIEVGGVQGTVRSISVRSTRIETFDRADVIVPNSNLITGTVTNMTKYSRVGRLIVPVGVAYGSDTRKVDRVLREIAEAHPLVVLNPKPIVLFAGFGADSLHFEIRVILRDVNFVLDVKNEMNHQIAERFAKEGFEIPFAQRDIWIRNPEMLRGEPPKEAP